MPNFLTHDSKILKNILRPGAALRAGRRSFGSPSDGRSAGFCEHKTNRDFFAVRIIKQACNLDCHRSRSADIHYYFFKEYTTLAEKGRFFGHFLGEKTKKVLIFDSGSQITRKRG